MVKIEDCVSGCVLSGRAPTPAGTSMLTMLNFCTHMKCKVKKNGGYENVALVSSHEINSHEINSNEINSQ